VNDHIKRNAADHEQHLRNWQQEKKRAGKWLPKSEYEKKTGKGRK
jgi:hypothetical protein